jgi:hypothetical protein
MMPQPFSSLRQATAFLLLVLAILLSPLLAGTWGLASREQMYSSISWRLGCYPYIYRQIFQEKGDIDIAFIGSSHMPSDIDTPYVQQQLSEKLGRPATVITLGWDAAGFDADYNFTKEMLEHRKVHLIVFYNDRSAPDAPPPPDAPHPNAWRWARWADEPDLSGLPLRLRISLGISYYYGSVLSMPRNILNCLRSNLEPVESPELFQDLYHATLPTLQLGTWSSQYGYVRNPHLFVPYIPETNCTPSDVRIYSPETRDYFQFSGRPIPTVQAYFARQFLALAKEHSVNLVCLNLPMIEAQRTNVIQEDRIWPDIFSADAPLVGIAPARLFDGLSDDEVIKLYQDPGHFNQNGLTYFTRIITPALIQLYEQAKP